MSQAAIAQRQPDHLGLLVAGYVMAFVLPIGGLVAAFALSERRTGHGVAIAMLSVWSGMLWVWLVARGLG